MSEVFWAKLYCKISDLFSSFCWLRNFLLENLKLKPPGDVHRNVWTNIIKLYAQNNIFKKGIQIWDFESLIFWSSFVFRGTALERFMLRFFYSGKFYSGPRPPPHHKKASYGHEMKTVWDISKLFLIALTGIC